ncbi:MAG: hypothetical protein OXB94_06995 [Nitrospira sp.]|nr:hypothetical protein [Nitrospira sp.]
MPTLHWLTRDDGDDLRAAAHVLYELLRETFAQLVAEADAANMLVQVENSDREVILTEY